jgi:hypothetical protein
MLALGTLAGAGVLWRRRQQDKRRMTKEPSESYRRDTAADRWARPGMLVTFRAEVMPARDRAARTFRIIKILPSNRVLLEGVAGEHAEQEFERVR